MTYPKAAGFKSRGSQLLGVYLDSCPIKSPDGELTTHIWTVPPPFPSYLPAFKAIEKTRICKNAQH